jgi:hypothetical protein
MAVTETTTTYGGATVTKRTGTTDAQVADLPRDPDPSTVNVNETEVSLSTVVTDPSAENAVILGEPGSLDLPAHAAAGPTPEDQFAGSGSGSGSGSGDPTPSGSGSGSGSGDPTPSGSGSGA